MTTIECLRGFPFLGRKYAALYEAAEATAFQHPVWLHSFYRHVAPEADAEPVILSFRDGGELSGVVPMIRRRKNGLRLLETTDLGV